MTTTPNPLTPAEAATLQTLRRELEAAIDGGTSLTMADLTPEAADLLRRGNAIDGGMMLWGADDE